VLSNEEMQKFWSEKEEFNEKLVNKAVAYYEGGHPEYRARNFGLLFLMSESLNFESFEKRVFLPSTRSKFKKIRFRIPLGDITAYRVVLPEEPSLKQFWKILKKGEPSRIEVDVKFFGHSKTIVFTEIVPFEQWEECLNRLIEKK